MEIAAAYAPVTYVTEGMRSLILVDFEWDTILLGFALRRCRAPSCSGSTCADPAL